MSELTEVPLIGGPDNVVERPLRKSHWELCAELDALTLSYFAAYEKVLECQSRLAKILQRGFLHIAKAKYTMGPVAVSQIQYDKNMAASVRLDMSCLCDQMGESQGPETHICLVRRSIEYAAPQRTSPFASLTTGWDTSSQESYETDDDNSLHGDQRAPETIMDRLDKITSRTSSASRSGLRRRVKTDTEEGVELRVKDSKTKVKGDDMTKTADAVVPQLKEGKGEKRVRGRAPVVIRDGLAPAVDTELELEKFGAPVYENRRDPLLWFGVLVSPHLRHSQHSFREAIDMVIQMANARHRMARCWRQYQDRLARKSRLHLDVDVDVETAAPIAAAAVAR